MLLKAVALLATPPATIFDDDLYGWAAFRVYPMWDQDWVVSLWW